jgi:uncharacterized protein
MKSQSLPAMVRLGPLLLPGAEARQIVGALRVSELERAEALLTSTEGELAVSLCLNPADSGQVRVTGHIAGTLWLTCQRCLEPCRWVVGLAVDVMLIDSEAAEERLADGQEAVVVDDGQLRLWTLVEDEVLLGMPLVALHQDAGECVSTGHDAARNAPQPAGPGQSHPFAALGALRDGKGDESS